MNDADRVLARARDGSSGRRCLTVVTVVAAWSLSAVGSQARPGVFFSSDGCRGAARLLSGFLEPDLTTAFLRRVARLMVESMGIGVLGLAIALVLGVPLAVVAARLPELVDPPAVSPVRSGLFGGVRFFARSVLAFWRAVPEIVWAFLFVRVFGLGPGPAVLAIGLTFGGIIGKLYAELLEACDPEPIRAMRRAGAGWFAVLVAAALPQVRRQWQAYALFRFECGVRSAAILGVVGAGGIGFEIDLAIRYFEYDKLATELLALWVVVAGFESASAVLRLRKPAWSFALLALGFVAGLFALDVPWSALVDDTAGEQVVRFIRGFAMPNLDGGFLGRGGWLVAETLAMAFLGTTVAAAAAFILAPFASGPLMHGSFLTDPPRPCGVGDRLRLLVFWATRVLFQVTRALPELVWALLFVVWVGPGPFAGALAVAAHTFGILGRLFAETQEEAEPGPARLLEGIGSPRTGRWLYAVIPQVAPRLVSFALFRFEVNVRATAMVGFVGAGGIGDAIHTAISLFHMRDLASLLLLVFITVLSVDAAGGVLRRRLLRV